MPSPSAPSTTRTGYSKRLLFTRTSHGSPSTSATALIR